MRAATAVGTQTPLRRALPGWAVDRIRDGVPPTDLRARGDRAVFAALVSTAMSAIQREIAYAEWHGLIIETRSNLGRQARLSKGRTDIGRDRLARQLRRAWAAAAANVATSPRLTCSRIKAVSQALLFNIEAADEWTGTAEPLDRKVYAHALAEAARRGTTSPVLPVREVEQATGVPRSTVYRSLSRLQEAGLLTLKCRGKRGAGGSGKATTYEIPAVAATAHSNGSLRSPYVPRPAVGHRAIAAGAPSPMSHVPEVAR